MDEFVETLFDTYWKVNENGEYMSLTDCGDFYIAKVAPCARNWRIVIECNCFTFHCKEFVYHENGAMLEIGMEINSLYLNQMEIRDLKIYMIDC